MRIGYCTWGMPTVPADVFIPFLHRLGYHGVEITVIPGYTTELSTLDTAERRRILQMLRDHHLELPAIAGHTAMLDRDPEAWAAAWKRLTGAVDLAVDWAIDGNVPALDTTLGGKSDQWDDLFPLIVERVGELVRYGEQRGVVIAIEPHVANVLDSIPRVQQLLNAIPSPFLKLNYDISHFNVQGVPIAESVAALAPYTVHTHIKDERGVVPNYEFLIPGEGDFDLVTYLQEMKKNGYDGYITAEVSIMVQKRPGYDPLAAAEQTYRHMAQAFDEAGFDR